MKKVVMLEYCFMFDPTDTWQHIYQFEQDLTKFFNEHNMEAQVTTPMNGYQGRKILLIQAKPQVEGIELKAPKEGAVQKQVNKLRGTK